MKARQVCVVPEYGAILIAARPHARNVLAGNSDETNEARIEGQAVNHATGAQGE